MPWNSEGGGGNQGPWGQGPWGQGPRRPNGGGGRGPTPPDLDELIRRGQDKLKRVLPSGGGGRASWLVPVVLLGAFWVYNSINQVQADERGVVPVDPVDPTTTPTTSREALAQWSACMSVDDWLSSQVYTWANKGSERGQCMSCHNQGAGGYYASNDPNEMYSMNRYELFITTFFTATPVNVADPSQGYKIVVNESKLRAKANATGHPSYNPDGNQMNYLHDFYDLTEARRLAGTCAPGGFPEPPAQ